MIYLIALITGLVLGLVLSPGESRENRSYDTVALTTSIVGALLGVLFFINFLGIRLTVGFLWLEAILWSLLGALILRLIVGAFSYETEDRRIESARPVSHEYRRKRVVRKRRRD